MAQEIAVFERNTALPLSVSMLVDTSGSTGKDLGYELESVTRFFRALLREGNADDTAALYSFNWQVTLHAPYTREILRLERGLADVALRWGDIALRRDLSAARGMEGRDGRHAMILVTDGGDTTSTKDFDAALEAAQRAETALYAIVVVPIPNEVDERSRGEHALATMAARTGGRIFMPAPGQRAGPGVRRDPARAADAVSIGLLPERLAGDEEQVSHRDGGGAEAGFAGYHAQRILWRGGAVAALANGFQRGKIEGAGAGADVRRGGVSAAAGGGRRAGEGELADDREFGGTVEFFDAQFIRLTREEGPNLFLYKHDIKYLYEDPGE